MRTLLVDDLRAFVTPRPAVIARSSAVAVDVLIANEFLGERFDEVWLDHDLGDATGADDTVMPVVDWLCEQADSGEQPNVGTVYVHTSNRAGADTIVRALERYGYDVKRVPAEAHLRIDGNLHAQALARTAELPGGGMQ